MQGDDYTEDEMQIIAERAGYSETSFIRKSESADLELRYFTPGHEMNLCGHATVASLYALCEKGMLESGKTYSIQTKAGILPVKISEKDGRIHITLEQASPQFKPFTGDRKNLRTHWVSPMKIFMKTFRLCLAALGYGQPSFRLNHWRLPKNGAR